MRYRQRFSWLSDASPQPSHRTRIIVWTRIGLVYGCLEGALWSPPHGRGAWSLAAAVFIAGYLVADLAHGVLHARDLGLGLRGLAAGWWIPPAAMLLSASIVIGGWQANTLHELFGATAPVTHAAGYAVWTVIQEFIAQSFFFLQLCRVLKPRQAIAVNGLLFGMAHWPNPVLVPVTLAGGWFLTACFARIRNIYPLALAHTLVALSIAVSVPDHIHRHMRVGFGYEHDHGHGHGNRAAPPNLSSQFATTWRCHEQSGYPFHPTVPSHMKRRGSDREPPSVWVYVKGTASAVPQESPRGAPPRARRRAQLEPLSLFPRPPSPSFYL